MDPDVEELVKGERLVAAAELAATRGQATLASELFERACEWRRAGQWALAAGDAARALPLSVMAQDDATAERALAVVVTDAAAIGRVAGRLERRGDHAWCGKLYEAAGQKTEAARAW